MKRGCVFAVDEKYIVPFKVFFYSLIKTKSLPKNLQIFIFHDNKFGKINKNNLKYFLNSFNYEPIFYDASTYIKKTHKVKISEHVSEATFYRLFCSSIISKDIKSIVYLDIDLIALSSIQELFYKKIKSPIAAVDHCSPINSIRIWGDTGGNYFQAGVLIIDLEWWRENKVENHFSYILEKFDKEIIFWDQDILNIAFKNKWERLPMNFNVSESTFNILTDEPSLNYALDPILSNIKIIHYDGLFKPWIEKYINVNRPYKQKWLDTYKELYGKSLYKTTIFNRLRIFLLNLKFVKLIYIARKITSIF